MLPLVQESSIVCHYSGSIQWPITLLQKRHLQTFLGNVHSYYVCSEIGVGVQTSGTIVRGSSGITLFSLAVPSCVGAMSVTSDGFSHHWGKKRRVLRSSGLCYQNIAGTLAYGMPA